MMRFFKPVCSLFALLPFAPVLSAADVRLKINPVSVTYAGASVVFGQGGRVGNWLSGTGNVIVLDAKVQTSSNPPELGSYLTNIFTTTTSGALTLISDATTSAQWAPGNGFDIPATGMYLGNAWFCPGTPSTAYILFEAQNNGSHVGVAGQPGAGYDNDVWIYRPATVSAPPKVWKLTNYGTSGTTTPVQGVLGPQCSQDSSSSANQLHIVYGHAKPGAPKVQCGNGPSNGTCWWFGEWELVYADVYFNSSGDPDIDHACGGTCAEPGLVQSTIQHVNPRDVACNPTCGPITGTSTPSGNVLTAISPSLPLGSGIVGVGIVVGLAGGGSTYTTVSCFNGVPGDYATVTPPVSCLPATTSNLTVNLPASTALDGTFTIKNFVVYEPHWYVSNLGDLYLTSNRRPVYHDGVGGLFNVTSGNFQEYAGRRPPYVPAGATPATGFTNTFWNEFLTPDPSGAHFMFMSDRATTKPANFTKDPEFSDHYLCTGPNCKNVVRLTYYDDTGIDATVPACAVPSPPSYCFPITAVRGAWSPDGRNYMTLVEYLAYSTGPPRTLPGAVLYNYSLSYPSTEISGGVTL